MGFRTIESDIKSGKINSALPILLYGEEHFLVDFYEKKLRALFFGNLDEAGNVGENAQSSDASNLDLSVFYGDEEPDDAIIGALDTFPMLSPMRIVVVKEHPGLSSPKNSATSSAEDSKGENIVQTKRKDELADYIAHIPETSRLIFASEKINKTRVLYKAINKSGLVYEFTRLEELDLRQFIIKRFTALGVNITTDVLDEFIFATGYLEKDSDRDLFSVENDVSKTAIFSLAEGRTVVTQADIEECMPGILRIDVFAMLDAISSGKKAEAVRLLENSLASGQNVFQLLSLVTGHFEIMLGYKELNAKGHNQKEITKILGGRSEWRVKRLGDFSRRFDEEKLKQILMKLYDMERSIKSGDIADTLVFTVLFAEI